MSIQAQRALVPIVFALVAGAMGYVRGLEVGTPVFDIVEIVWLAPGNGVPAHRRAVEFDIPYRLAQEINAAATRYGIPSDLAYALIGAESEFTRTAQSPVGALGYTQVMPSTGLWHCGLEPDDLLDTRLNLDCGFSYLRSMHTRFGGWRLALVAYHRGPTRTDYEIFNGFGHALSEPYATGILAGADTTGGV